MSEDVLRGYWQAYTSAWQMLKNYEQVTAAQIAEKIHKSEQTIFSRIFCLVVWQEVKRAKHDPRAVDISKYKTIINTAWQLFKKYCQPDDSEAFWDGLVDEILAVLQKYTGDPLVQNLFIHVTLEEIERLWKEKKEEMNMFLLDHFFDEYEQLRNSMTEEDICEHDIELAIAMLKKLRDE